MPGSDLAAERTEFTERIRLQLRSRYPTVRPEPHPTRFALRVAGAGIDLVLPLGPLHQAVRRQPERAAGLILDWVTSIADRLTPATEVAGFSLKRVLWCVRTRRYLADLTRRDELLVEPLAGELVAFVAEQLPGSYMRGVPHAEWERGGHDESAVRRAADTATAARFATLEQRIRAISRIARDGWQISGTDQLFQGSMLLVPSILSALAERSGGDVLLAVPDRSVVLAIPRHADGALRFRARVTQAYREGMTPCSREVYITDGRALRIAEAARDRHGGFMGWLDD